MLVNTHPQHTIPSSLQHWCAEGHAWTNRKLNLDAGSFATYYCYLLRFNNCKSERKNVLCGNNVSISFFLFSFFVRQGNIYGERPNSQWIRELLWWCNADLWPDFICHFYDYKHPELAAAKSVGEVVILKISFNLCRSFTVFWWFIYLFIFCM